MLGAGEGIWFSNIDEIYKWPLSNDILDVML
jgi:hypothetical protein